MKLQFFAGLLAALVAATGTAALAAAGKRPPPAGAIAGAPDEYTQFTSAELLRGFMALAFGSDLSIGTGSKTVRKFDRAIRARVVSSGSVDRKAAMEKILAEYARKVPALNLSVAASNDDDADVTVRLIDEKDFGNAIEAAFGRETARAFVAKTDPQCMTSVRSDQDGEIIYSISFVIVDQGDDVFQDCAYHELLHAFGLSNHDDKNPWTTLNQERLIGYLPVYDQSLLTLLYDERIETGMTPAQARRRLPEVIRALGLAADGRSGR